MKIKPALVLLVFITSKAFTQDTTNNLKDTTNLLNLVNKDVPHKEYVYGAFKSSRVIMMQSIEMLRPGVLDFRIMHRFGAFNSGAYNFFGLDGPAMVRLGLDYGISKNITIGIGHSTLYKELDYFIKYRPVQQATGPGASSVSLVFVGRNIFRV